MDLQQRTTAMAEKMSRQMRVKGSGLSDTVERAGRKLPKRLRPDVQILIDAEARAQNPKLSRQINLHQLDRAERRLSSYLDKLDPKAERRGEILDRIAGVAFVLVVVALSAFFFLLWQGHFE